MYQNTTISGSGHIVLQPSTENISTTTQTIVYTSPITTMSAGCNVLVSGGSGNINYATITIGDEIVEFFDFISDVLGLGINYEKFKNMSKPERITLLRNIKISQILR